MQSRTSYSFTALCVEVGERLATVQVTKEQDGQASSLMSSLGWFASFAIGGQTISFGFGAEKPELAKGDKVKFQLSKEAISTT